VCLPGFIVVLMAMYGWCFEPVNGPSPEPPVPMGGTPSAVHTPVASH
jgi:hypothetical protein